WEHFGGYLFIIPTLAIFSSNNYACGYGGHGYSCCRPLHCGRYWSYGFY
uniref:Uncharacterized protein n=1 Tax=Equus asinus asinus TaxID=83772 RepID=A0A8C4LPK8_EQUAS